MAGKKAFSVPTLTEYGPLSELTLTHDPNEGQNPCNADPQGSPPEHAKQAPNYDCISIGSS